MSWERDSKKARRKIAALLRYHFQEFNVLVRRGLPSAMTNPSKQAGEPRRTRSSTLEINA